VSSKNTLDPYTRHVSNASVRETTGCPPVSSIINTRRLRFFGHVACSDSRQDHDQAVSVSLRPPRHWRSPQGRLCTTWLRWINADVVGKRWYPLSFEDGQHSISSTRQDSFRGMPLKKTCIGFQLRSIHVIGLPVTAFGQKAVANSAVKSYIATGVVHIVERVTFQCRLCACILLQASLLPFSRRC